MRSFIALELPGAVKQAAGRMIAELKGCGADVKWVRPELMHLTLKFLGEIERDRVGEIAGALEQACAGAGPFALEIKGCGSFPAKGKPNVVWLGLAGEVPGLAALAADIEKAMQALGFEPEARGFSPHITLGRMRRGRGGGRHGPGGPEVTALKRALAGFSVYKGPAFTAACVILMMSTLRPEGPTYDPLHTITLTKQGS